MTQIVDRIIEGGPLFMVPLLLILITIIALFILAIIGKKEISKSKELIHHLTLFGLSWGFLGSTIGLITAFDAIGAAGDVSKGVVAGGLKVALLNTVFGLFTFSIGRILIIFLTLKSHKS